MTKLKLMKTGIYNCITTQARFSCALTRSKCTQLTHEIALNASQSVIHDTHYTKDLANWKPKLYQINIHKQLPKREWISQIRGVPGRYFEDTRKIKLMASISKFCMKKITLVQVTKQRLKTKSKIIFCQYDKGYRKERFIQVIWRLITSDFFTLTRSSVLSTFCTVRLPTAYHPQ